MASLKQFGLVLHDRTPDQRKALRRQRRQLRRMSLGTAPTDRSRFMSILIVSDRSSPGNYEMRSCGPGLRAMTRLVSARLDQHLAEGSPPEASRLMAARAEFLVSMEHRWMLAKNWRALMEQARRPTTRRDPRVPLCRLRILQSEPAIEAMLSALLNPLPVSARGVAMALRILCDGAGPLYDPLCEENLRATLSTVTTHLDPQVPLDGRG